MLVTFPWVLMYKDTVFSAGMTPENVVDAVPNSGYQRVTSGCCIPIVPSPKSLQYIFERKMCGRQYRVYRCGHRILMPGIVYCPNAKISRRQCVGLKEL